MRSALATALSLVLCALAAAARAGPAEDANALVDRWSAAYNTNDPQAVAAIYAPDAILLGTVSPVSSTGTAAILKYFGPLKGSGNTNTIQERHTVVLGEDAVLVTGFYMFTSLVDGKTIPRPSRFSMLAVKRDGQWRIAHHHSSPRVLPKQ